MTMFSQEMTNEDWLLLPIKLRQRWWNETDFGRCAPSEDLKKAIREAIKRDKS